MRLQTLLAYQRRALKKDAKVIMFPGYVVFARHSVIANQVVINRKVFHKLMSTLEKRVLFIFMISDKTHLYYWRINRVKGENMSDFKK